MPVRILVFLLANLFLLFGGRSAHGQAPKQGFRALYEMKLKDAREPDFLITEVNGCLLGWYPDRFQEKAPSIRIKGLDSLMRPVWEGFYQVKPEYELRFSEQDFSGTAVWLVFFDKLKTGEALLLKVNYANGAYESRKVKFPFEPDIQDVMAGKDGLYFRGLFQDKHVLAFSSFDEQFVRILPYISQKNTELCGTSLDTSGMEITTITRIKTGYRKERSTLRTYRNGFFTGNSRELTSAKDRKQPHAMFQNPFTDSVWIGTWTSATLEYSQGFIRLNKEGVKTTTHLVDDTAFVRMFSPARRRRMARLDAGERKDKFMQYRYYHHPLLQRANSSVLLMESYLERNVNVYSLPPFSPMGGYGMAPRIYYFDHLLLARFTPEGTLAATAAIKLPGISSPSLGPQVAMLSDTTLVMKRANACLFINPYKKNADWEEFPPVRLGLPEKAAPTMYGVIQEGNFVYTWGKLEGKEEVYFMSKVRE